MDKKLENVIVYGNDARTALKKGIDTVADAVKITLGARGRNVLISNDRGKSPHISRDGVTVAKSILVKNPLERQGALLVQEVADTTNKIVGDGTSTTSVLTQKMCGDGLIMMNDGMNMNSFRQGMLQASDDVKKLILDNAVKIESREDVRNIATISANNDTVIGELIADAYEQIGKHGVISVDRSENTNTYTEYVDGYQFDRGLISPYFITEPEKMRSTLINPYIIVTDYILTRADDFKDIMNEVSRTGRPILLICEDMEFACAQDFIRNHVNGFLKMAVVKAPEFGDRRYDMLEDICTVTGAKFIGKERGDSILNLKIEDLGEANLVTVDLDNTTIVGGQGATEKIEKRVSEIKDLMAGKKGYESEVYEKRLGKLTGGAAVIRIGAKTEVDLNELKDRVEDALSAVKASMEEGILIGGGAFLARIYYGVFDTDTCENKNEDLKKGYDLIIDSLIEPMSIILKNGDMFDKMEDFRNTINEEDTTGVNVMTGEIVDMFKVGIVDPAKVTRSAVENAVSVASTLLLTEAIVLGDDYSEKTPHDLFG